MILLFAMGTSHASLLDNAVAGTFIDNKGKVQAGFFTSIISYRSINLDVGLIGNINSAQTMCGVSCDLRKISEEWGLEYHLSENWVVGAYGHYQLDERDFSYGFYIGSKIF